MPDEDPGKSTITQPKLASIADGLSPEDIALNAEDSQDEISSQDSEQKSDIKKSNDSTKPDSSSNFA